MKQALRYLLAYILFLQLFLIGTAHAVHFASLHTNTDNAFNPAAILCLNIANQPAPASDDTNSHERILLAPCCIHTSRIDVLEPVKEPVFIAFQQIEPADSFEEKNTQRAPAAIAAPPPSHAPPRT